MNEMQDDRQHKALQNSPAPRTSGSSKVWKAIVIVLAVIGALALIGIASMFWMHGSMMGGMGGTGMGMGMGMGMGGR